MTHEQIYFLSLLGIIGFSVITGIALGYPIGHGKGFAKGVSKGGEIWRDAIRRDAEEADEILNARDIS